MFAQKPPQTLQQNSGIKVSEASRFASKPKKPSVETLQNTANQIEEQKTKHLEIISQAFLTYSNLVKDKTLKINKSSIQLDLEEQVLFNIISAVDAYNTDPYEDECKGSTALGGLILKCLLFYRDRLNQLEQTNEELVERIQKLELANGKK